MFDCLVLGDSIAIGLAAVLNSNGTVCAAAARVGAGSRELSDQIARMEPHFITIISVGSNDPGSTGGLDANLAAARSMLSRGRVVWVLPYDRRSAYSVTQVAFRFGDELIDLAGFATRDHVHPVSYRDVAAVLRR